MGEKTEENPKKSSLFSILFFLEYHCCVSQTIERTTLQTSFLSASYKSGSVLPLAFVETKPLFAQEQNLNFCRFPKLSFGGGLESTSSVEMKPRGPPFPHLDQRFVIDSSK